MAQCLVVVLYLLISGYEEKCDLSRLSCERFRISGMRSAWCPKDARSAITSMFLNN